LSLLYERILTISIMVERKSYREGDSGYGTLK